MILATALLDLRPQLQVNPQVLGPAWAVWAWEWDNQPVGVVAWVWQAKGDGPEVLDVKHLGLDLVATPRRPVAKPRPPQEAFLAVSVALVLQEAPAAMRGHRIPLKSEPPKY